MDILDDYLMMKVKYFHFLHTLSGLISIGALISSFFLAIFFVLKGNWAYFGLSVVSSLLQLYSLWQVLIWSSLIDVQDFEDEEDIPYDDSSTPYVILIVIFNLFAIYLLMYALYK